VEGALVAFLGQQPEALEVAKPIIDDPVPLENRIRLGDLRVFEV